MILSWHGHDSNTEMMVKSSASGITEENGANSVHHLVSQSASII